MVKLLEQIKDDLVRAMKGKDAETTSALRMLTAALKNREIALRDKGAAELTDEQVAEVIASEIKKRRDAIEAYNQGGRPELADKESAEITILEKYLPEEMSDQELAKIIEEVIAAGAADFGRAMGQVMAKVKGKAQGARVGEMVKKILAK